MQCRAKDLTSQRQLADPRIKAAIARNLAINLYRQAGFSNMAQAQRQCQFSLEHITSLFRMK